MAGELSINRWLTRFFLLGENATMTSKKQIGSDLQAAFLGVKALSNDLYVEELADYEDELKDSLNQDADDALLCVFADRGEVAMMVVEPGGTIYRNEQAVAKLQAMLPKTLDVNLQVLLPMFSADISRGDFGVAGIKWLPAQST